MKGVFFNIIITISLLTYGICNCQNLVPNGDFEITGIDPCSFSRTAEEFNSSTNGWDSPTRATPDLFTTLNSEDCFNHAPKSTAKCSFGPQLPHSGTTYAGIHVGPTYWREYLQIKLLNIFTN